MFVRVATTLATPGLGTCDDVCENDDLVAALEEQPRRLR
jgi:hypothetical protein